MEWQRECINSLIEEAILEAEEKGTKVLTFGLHNQASSFYLPPFKNESQQLGIKHKK